MRRFIDLDGLSPVDPDRVADALGLEGERVGRPDRLHLLAQLISGAGVTVTTGPRGIPFWSGVSSEVVVRVEPDGYELDERCPIEDDNGLKWSLRVAGLTSGEVSALLRGRTKPPSARHSLAGVWSQAERIRDELLVQGAVTPLIEEDFVVTVIEDPDEQLTFLATLDEFCALDWEWDPYDPSTVDGLSCATRTGTYYLPCRASDYRVPASHGVQLRSLFGKRLRDGLPCVFHQGRADLSYIYDSDPAELSGKPIHDSLLLAYLADPYAADLGLKPLTRKYLGREPRGYPGRLSDLPLAEGARYAGADARNTFDLFMKLAPELVRTNQWKVYMEYEQPLMPIVASMEKYGQPVDVAELQREYDAHLELETNIRDAVEVAYGYDLSDNESTKDWLLELTGYRPASLDQRAISKYEIGEVDVILAYRQTRTRRNNFLGRAIRRWTTAGLPDSFRLYPKFNQAGKDNADGSIGRAARTGRFTSSGSRVAWERAFGAPNFQQQPRSIRDVFVAPLGLAFTSWDYSAIELRIAAGLSGDPVMLAALNNGEDLHGLFRAKILALTGIDVGRVAAKSGNFEQLYGGGPQMLVRILRKMRAFINLETATAIVLGHEATFPVYHEWARRTLALARERGYSETLFGRRRYLPELYSADSDIRGNAERAAVNHVIQGTSADIVKLAMIRLSPIFMRYGGHLAITVHDELDGWVDSPYCDGHDCDHPFCIEVKHAMTDMAIPGVALKVEGGVGPSWGAVHG